MNCVLVTGSREWDDETTIKEALLNYDPRDTLLVVGDAKGADSIATQTWRSRGGKCLVFKPDWNKHGRKAGPLRNLEMIEYVLSQESVTVLAFNLGTPGTTHTIKESQKEGLHVIEYKK